MANEIKIANQATPTDVVSAAISRPLSNKVVLLPHVYAEDLPVGTNVRQARKDDALGLGATVSEAGNYDFTTGDSEFTQTKVQLTMAKTVLAVKVTAEAMQFTSLSDQEIINKLSNGLSRTLDNAIKTLIDGFSQVVDAEGPLTADALLQAKYLIEAGNAGRDGQPLIFAGDPKGIYQLQKEALYSGANAFSATPSISLLSGVTTPAGWAGRLPGIELYQVNGLATGGGNRKAGLWNPDLAFYGNYGTVQIVRKGMDSQGFYNEISAYIFNQVAEWNDEAGIEVQSVS